MRQFYLFIRDLWVELPAVWAIARSNHCDRNGGHRWGGSSYDATMRAFGSTCSRCGSWQSSPMQPIITNTTGTGSQYTLTFGG